MQKLKGKCNVHSKTGVGNKLENLMLDNGGSCCLIIALVIFGFELLIIPF